MPTACNIYCQKTRKGNQKEEKEERIALGSAALNLKRAAGALPAAQQLYTAALQLTSVHAPTRQQSCSQKPFGRYLLR